MLVCDILYSNLMEPYFLFELFKQIVSSSLVPVHMKNILLMNRKGRSICISFQSDP